MRCLILWCISPWGDIERHLGDGKLEVNLAEACVRGVGAVARVRTRAAAADGRMMS